jgi:hypothetical protein
MVSSAQVDAMAWYTEAGWPGWRRSAQLQAGEPKEVVAALEFLMLLGFNNEWEAGGT